MVKSGYQLIEVKHDQIEWGEHVLYLDRTFQYNSGFEYRYHELLAAMPAVAADSLERILICGGGDGLAARELLRFGRVQIDLVEIDPEMTRIYSENPLLTKLNRESLKDERLKIHNMDALKFAGVADRESYGLIILDFPSPASANEGKNYQNLFAPEVTNLFTRLLRPDGVLAAQTSIKQDRLAPFVRNFVEQNYYVWNYDAVYNRVGSHDNFTIACKRPLKKQRPIPSLCRYITDEHVKVGFGPATEVDNTELDYWRLFEHVEGIEFERRIDETL
jgi:spermidine synthase